MSELRTLALIDDLLAFPAETAWVEFKENNTDPRSIGRLISAISNAARIAGRDFGYVVWGVGDHGHAVVGTRFEPAAAKHRQQPLEFWLSQMLQPDVAFSFQPVEHPQGRLILLEIAAATTAPVEFDRTAYVRIGSATPRLADHSERQRVLWDSLRPYAWETGIAQQFVSAGEALDLLNSRSYFELLGKPLPESDEGVLAGLESDQLISRDVGGNWNIHNLGAILGLMRQHRPCPNSAAREHSALIPLSQIHPGVKPRHLFGVAV